MNIIRNSTLLFFLLLMFLSSCGQTKVDTDKAFEFLDDVNAQIGLNKPAQQKFIDKMTVAILAVRDNKNASIDTKELESLLNFSNGKNLEREKKLENLVEVDNEINLKQKTLDYVKIFNDAYQNEFPKTIQIFSDKSDDRFERAKEMLFPKLQSIKEREVEMKNAQKAFEAKYTELSKSQPKRTGADYEFIKLKDFQFIATIINDGAKIELLSFSGGEEVNDDKLYYKQFIGIEKSTGDVSFPEVRPFKS